MFGLVRLLGGETRFRMAKRSGSSIKVILLDAVESWGSAGEIVSVKRGFARNFLVPRSKAAYATPENKTRYKTLLEKNKVVSVSHSVPQVSVPSAEEIANLINKRSLKIIKEVNEQGVCFASVSALDVLSAARTQCGVDLNIPKSAVTLSSDLAAKKTGTFKVSIAGAVVEVIVEAATKKA